MAGARRANDVVIRERHEADDDAICRLNDAAFGGAYECRLIEDLRAAGLAAIELVATEQAAIVGHIVFSDLSVTFRDRSVRALALAPMAVQPDRQGQGVGSMLVRTGLDIARTRTWQAVIVLGHPNFYPRFGFSAELARPLKAPFRGRSFMALELDSDALHGSDGLVVYPAAFGIDRS